MKKIAFVAIFLVFTVLGISATHTELDFPITSEKLSKKLIVLTFDDGPRPKVLFDENGLFSLLTANKLPAHFFMVGKLVELHGDRVKFLNKKGFLIENHSYDHENLLKVARLAGQETVLKNIRKTSKIIYETTGRKPKYFRPPYLAINDSIKHLAEEEGLVVISPHKAEINTRDYAFHSQKGSSGELIANVKKELTLKEQAGFTRHILLFHELPITTEALRSLIPWFLSRGYQFATLDNFLEMSK